MSSSPTQVPHRRFHRILAAAILLLLVLTSVLLCSGSYLFRTGAMAALAGQDCTLRLNGPSIRPAGFLAFSSWELSRNGKLILQGQNLAGRYTFFPGCGFQLNLRGENLNSGPAFPELFPKHHEKIPSVELHCFTFQAAAKGLSKTAMEKSLESELDMDIRRISLESSGLCRKIYDNTGVRVDRYLQFGEGALKIRQKQRSLTIKSIRPLTGPYQILSLDGGTDLDSQKIDLKLTFGLQPELIRKIRRKNFFRYLIPGDWDEKAPIFLPAPVILTGTIQHPRIDVGELFRKQPQKGGRKRVRLKLKKNPGDGHYQIQLPEAGKKRETKP